MVPRRLPIAGVASVTIAMLLGTVAVTHANPDLEKGRRLLAELFVDKAGVAFKNALEQGDSDPATTAQIYMGLGEVAAVVGTPKKAEEYFRHALAIDTLLDLPPGTSPTVQEPLSKARASFRKLKPLAAAVNIDTANGVRASVSVTSDPLDMVAGASVIFEIGDKKKTRNFKSGKQRIPIPLAEKSTAITVSLIDKHGNRIVTNDRIELPEGKKIGDNSSDKDNSSDIPITKSTTSQQSSIATNWIVWAGAAAVFGATGTGFGLWSRSAINEIDDLKKNSENVEFKTVLDLEDKAKQRALLANIGFGLAGACAIAATVFYFRGRASHSQDESVSRHAEIIPIVSPNQIGFAAALHF